MAIPQISPPCPRRMPAKLCRAASFLNPERGTVKRVMEKIKIEKKKVPRRRRNNKKQEVKVLVAPGLKKAKPMKAAAVPSADREMVDALKSVVSKRQQKVRDYLMHLIDPCNTNPVRIPDASVGMNKTGLVTSEMSIDVSVNLSATDPGRFGIVISPTLGDASDPHDYKIAMVDTSGQWPSNFSVPASFSKTSGTTALTVDPNSSMLVQPPAQSFGGLNEIALVTDDPLAIRSGNFAVQSVTTDTWNPALGGPNLFVLGTFGAIPTSRLTLSPGQYDVAFDSILNNGAGDPVSHSITYTTADTNVHVSGQYLSSSTIDPSSHYVISVYDRPGTIDFYWDPADNGQPTTTWLTNVVINSSWYRPDQLNQSAPGYPLDGGYIRQYVPVAMSALATFMSPDLTVGGDIACAWLSPGTCSSDVFVSEARPAVGNLFNVENLRRYPGAYDGKLRDGAYQIWKPSSFEDCFLYSPSAARDRAWPCLAISGKANSSGATGITLMLRLKVWTTYQYYTDIVCFPLMEVDGSRAIMEEAFRLLRTFPTSSANGPHFENIKQFFQRVLGGARKIYGFYKENEGAFDTALSLGKGAITLASFL